jgi:hypothetical protein
MKEATFTKDGITIKATAKSDAGMGFLSNLTYSGCYTQSEAFDLCYEYNEYVSIEVITLRPAKG